MTTNYRRRQGEKISGLLEAERPRDPRSRAVVRSVTHVSKVDLHLDCGHVTRRRFISTIPAYAICHECPNVGGINMHENRRLR